MSAWSHLDFDQIGDLDAMFIGGCVSNQSGPLRVWGPSGKQPELGTNFAIERMREMFTRDLTGRKGKKFVYSGETVPNQWFLAEAGGTDLRIHEC